MNKRFKVNFVPFSNFGDTSVPYMLNKLGVPFIFAHHTVDKKTIMTGSILSVGSRKDTIVWGSGLMWGNMKPRNDCNYLAVRGPRTLEKVLEVGIDISNIVLGDPALLLPKVFQPKVEKKYKLGIIPHIVDIDLVNRHMKENPKNFVNSKLIDPNTNTSKIEDFIIQVNQCERIVSTSLHGIICAHAYGIPAKWMKVSDKLAGDNTKFYDYFESVGMYGESPMDLLEDENVEMHDFKMLLDVEKLWDCRPWETASDEYFVDLDNPDWMTECYPEGYKDRLWTDEYFKL